MLRLEDADGTSCLTNAEIFEVPKPHHGMSSAALWHLPSFVLLKIRNSISQVYQARIEKLESKVERLEDDNRVLKELKSIHSLVDYDKTVMEKEKSFKQGREIADIDADVEFNLEKAQDEAYNLDLDHQEKVLSMLDVNNEELADVEEVLEVVKAAKLTTEVVTTVGVDVNAASVQDTSITAVEATKVQAKDKGKAILIEEPKALKRQAQIKLDEEVVRQLEAELNANINWNAVIEKVKGNMVVYKMDYFKGMSYNEIRPLFEKHYNYNQAFLNEVNKGVKVPEKEVNQEKEVKLQRSKREGRSLEQEIAKKQKMEQETEELKKHLHIVPDDDDDDDVYIDATPLASKILIIDYQIHTKRNKPHFKIIRADGNHRLILSFSTMLKNFDREDLESLWNIVRERFAKTEPNNYLNDFLLNTLKIMFEKPNVEGNVWKDKKGKYGLAKIFLLVERMYPLTHFTLEQVVNEVRLEVEDESEMSLELLRLVRRQLNEGYLHQ
nr:hypothetical protein [Tanacetum cinerariifolium]